MLRGQASICHGESRTRWYGCSRTLPSEQHPPHAGPASPRPQRVCFMMAVWSQEPGAEDALRCFVSAPLKSFTFYICLLNARHVSRVRIWAQEQNSHQSPAPALRSLTCRWGLGSYTCAGLDSEVVGQGEAPSSLGIGTHDKGEATKGHSRNEAELLW